MVKKWMCAFFLLSSLSLHAYNPRVPYVIDFSNLSQDQTIRYDGTDWDGIEKVCLPFENALELIPYFDDLQQTFKIDEAVKTGAWEGDTEKYLSFQFNKLLAIECVASNFEKAMQEKSFNVNIAFGFSPDMLKQYLPALEGKRVFFYLGTQQAFPRLLKEELEVIRQTHYDNCIIVISNFKVPGMNGLPYDIIRGEECSYRYIKSTLSKVFSSYECYYVIPRTKGASAKLVAIPKKWT